MPVSDRGLAVLRAIVHDYVESREPVGSKGIVERHAFGVSAATIRNDMALLEEEELIVAPHTSSGRVPTDKGYRLFVDQLADRQPLTLPQRRAIETFIGESLGIDEVLDRSVRLLAQITGQVALVQYPTFARAEVRHVELVSLTDTRILTILITDNGRVEQRVVDLQHPLVSDELDALKARLNQTVVGIAVADAIDALPPLRVRPDHPQHELIDGVLDVLIDELGEYRHDRLVMAGAANLARIEADFSGTLFPVLEALEQQVVLLRLFAEMQADHHGVSASIGRENESFGLGETSVVASNYRVSSNEFARLGVLGPTRMDYPGNIGAVRAVARYLSRQFGEDSP